MLDKLLKMEFYVACALLLVLPLSEALKSTLLAMLVLLSLARLVWAKKLFSRWPQRIELLLLALLAVSLLSTLLNLPYPNQFKGFLDTLRYVALFWLLYRQPWQPRQHQALALCVIGGTLLADLYSLYELYSGAIQALELHSVGVVTHSSLYQGMAGMLAAGFFLQAWQGGRETRRQTLAWGSLLFFMILFLFLMGSRGGIIAFAAALTGTLILLKQRSVLLLTASVLGISLALAGLLSHNANQTYMQEKLRQLTLEGKLPEADQIRLANWRVALKQISAGETPLLGLGPRNFAAIDLQRFTFDPPLPAGITFENHAHNLFLAKAVEEGWIGLALFCLLLSMVAARLFRDYRLKQTDWLWVGAFGALLIPLLGGQFNTPFYQEHALLAMSLMALLMGRSPRQDG